MQKPQYTLASQQGLSSNTSLESSSEKEMMMRRFIRHPSGIPIDFNVIESLHVSGGISPMMNISRGGLCFYCDTPFPAGTALHLSIPVETPAYEVDGRVAWSRMEEEHFVIGVSFDDSATAFNIRMVEQICYIEQYRKVISESEGRELSSEEAAMEWIEKYAADFPRH